MTGEPCAVTESGLRARLEAHHRAGFAWALSCCAFSVVEAEDVLQSVYRKILQGDAVYRGEAAFRTWLFAVIRNTAAQERRRSFWQRRRIVEDETLLDSAQVDDDASDRVYRAEIQTQVRAALKDLPRRQREVIMLVFYHELTLEQAAKVMRVSPGSARTHYDRAKRRLRQWIESANLTNGSRPGN